MAITYKLPETKPYENPGKEMPEMDTYYRPCVYLEISPEQLKALEVGAEVEVSITGTVKGLEMRERDGGKSRHEMDLEVSSITIPSDNVYEKMADEDEEEYS